MNRDNACNGSGQITEVGLTYSYNKNHYVSYVCPTCRKSLKNKIGAFQKPSTTIVKNHKAK